MRHPDSRNPVPHIVLEVPREHTGQTRVDIFIAAGVADTSRTAVQRDIGAGCVQVNGARVAKPSLLVQSGDVIRYHRRVKPPLKVVAEDLPLDIVYEDDWLVVINKAVGMPVHPGAGHPTGTLVHALLHHVGCATLESEGPQDVGLSTIYAHVGDAAIRPGIVHRLDKDTSGLLVVAKDDDTHRRLARQFELRTVRRTYTAIVWGTPDPAVSTIDAPVGRDPRDRKKMTVVPGGRGKHAVTHYETVEELFFTARVQFRLQTGRTHQIRVHARHMGHPVFGDPTYGGRTVFATRRRKFFTNLLEKLPHQALHAETLGFMHPRLEQEVSFHSDAPAGMQETLNKLRAMT